LSHKDNPDSESTAAHYLTLSTKILSSTIDFNNGNNQKCFLSIMWHWRLD